MDLRSPFAAFLDARPGAAIKADAERHQRRPIAEIVESIRAEGQRSGEDLTGERSDAPKCGVCLDTRRLFDLWQGRDVPCHYCVVILPQRTTAPGRQALGGRSASGTDNTHLVAPLNAGSIGGGVGHGEEADGP